MSVLRVRDGFNEEGDSSVQAPPPQVSLGVPLCPPSLHECCPCSTPVRSYTHGNPFPIEPLRGLDDLPACMPLCTRETRSATAHLRSGARARVLEGTTAL
jgi:hypothetical protein